MLVPGARLPVVCAAPSTGATVPVTAASLSGLATVTKAAVSTDSVKRGPRETVGSIVRWAAA